MFALRVVPCRLRRTLLRRSIGRIKQSFYDDGDLGRGGNRLALQSFNNRGFLRWTDGLWFHDLVANRRALAPGMGGSVCRVINFQIAPTVNGREGTTQNCRCEASDRGCGFLLQKTRHLTTAFHPKRTLARARLWFA